MVSTLRVSIEILEGKDEHSSESGSPVEGASALGRIPDQGLRVAVRGMGGMTLSCPHMAWLIEDLHCIVFILVASSS